MKLAQVVPIAVVLLAFARDAPSAFADQWAAPKPIALTSKNGKWTATIVPSRDPKIGPVAQIAERSKEGKTFTLRTRWSPVDCILFDDGSLLALDHWHRLGYDKVGTLYERDGTVRWEKTLVQLVGQTFADAADHSVSSIWWRKLPVEWSMTKDGKSVVITLFDESHLHIALRDGMPTLVVGTVPDDPQRLYNRAKGLSREPGEESNAIGMLERALAKDPDLFEAITLYIDILQRVKDHARVDAVLQRLSKRWKATTGYGLANVQVAWARSLVELSRRAEAERVLKLGVAATPTYSNPPIALATLYADAQRGKEADAVLDAFVDRLIKAAYLDTYALAQVADFYRRRKQLAKALVHYQKGYKTTEVTNQFLYTSLAELYEELGRRADAIRVHEQLLAHYQKLGSAFDTYATNTRAAIARLRNP